jgi:hypothetical protein
MVRRDHISFHCLSLDSRPPLYTAPASCAVIHFARSAAHELIDPGAWLNPEAYACVGENAEEEACREDPLILAGLVARKFAQQLSYPLLDRRADAFVPVHSSPGFDDA